MSAPSTPTPSSRLAAFRASPLFHGAVLGAFSLATAAVLTLSDALTAPAIAQRLQEDVEASLTAVLPPSLRDNDPTSTLRSLPDGDAEIPVFVAAQGQTVTGVAFEIAGNGYAGEIRLLMAVAPDGTLLGVRVLAHSETPGLGDKVEVAKSDWITQFTGLSLTNPAPSDWKVKRDGGVFDQFSGATITPRAVVSTVRRGLELFAGAAETLTAPLTDEEAS